MYNISNSVFLCYGFVEEILRKYFLETSSLPWMFTSSILLKITLIRNTCLLIVIEMLIIK